MLKGASAIWLSKVVFALPLSLADRAESFRLQGHPDLALTRFRLTPELQDLDWRTKLEPYVGLRLSCEDGGFCSKERLEALLKGSLVLQGLQGSEVAWSTGVQVGPVLDDLYAGAARQKLGVVWQEGTPTLKVWAPTASRVSLLLFNQGDDPMELPATRDKHGVWSVAGAPDWDGAEYLWEISVFAPCQGEFVTNRVTDPYSVGLTVDSTRSVVLDLQSPQWKPEGWGSAVPPALLNQAAQSIYELHVRDFSAWDKSVPQELRGTYRAFTLEDTAGTTALKELVEAGLTTLHLLPTFDIASSVIPEDRSVQKVPSIDGITLVPENQKSLAALVRWGPDSELPSRAVEEVVDTDAFNWGYEPYHWMCPEGSYASPGNQHGGRRVAEYRSMVESLHNLGLRVVQDVVFNHTTGSGMGSMSVLDKVVPGYYHRRSPNGDLETSTCCANIATERLMAEKLMVDTVVSAARDYRIDGFRFDLMGHHSLDNLKRVRGALDRLTAEKDGVDGRQIYLYGEGWNFGEVADDALFFQASQANIGGTGIGVFNDRLRDAVRGGAPMDLDQAKHQGFASGLGTDTRAGSRGDLEPEWENRAAISGLKLIRAGLIGALKDSGIEGVSRDVFCLEPQECVNYVEAHDNETLFDSGVWKLPRHSKQETRVRMQVLANALVTLGQAPAFWAAGTELLRSKSLDRDSYNSGDWFNAIDWTGDWHQFGRGLPPKASNEAAWGSMAPLLRLPGIRPSKQTIQLSKAMHLDLLRLRKAHPLLTLGSADLIRMAVSFPALETTDEPGLICMLVDGRALPGAEVAPGNDSAVLVVFNASPHLVQRQVDELRGRKFSLSDVQAGGADQIVKASKWLPDSATFRVTPRTVAVFVERWADDR